MLKNQKKAKLDLHTKKYIRNVKLMQLFVLLIVAISFAIFGHTMVSNNKENLKKVALAEVQESMEETIQNVIILIENLRWRVETQAMTDIMDLENRITKGGIKSIDDLLAYLEVCEENELGQAIKAIYTASDGQEYYINSYERLICELEGEKEDLYEEAAVCKEFEVSGQKITLLVRQAELDEFVKEDVHNYLHFEEYSGNQYVWVNEIVNMEGGDNYAIRRIHPSMPETEGEYLSTSMTDIEGNYPYKTELEGIREKGDVFHAYYFKNKIDDEIREKYSYARYYEPFHWVIATGETIEEVYAYSEEMNEQSFQQIFVLMILFSGLFILTSGFMINGLGKQSENFRKTLVKQAEVYEDIYTAMSVGMLRIRMTEDETSVLQINPKGLKTLGVESEEELLRKIHGHSIETMLPEDAQALEEACSNLKEQWESVVCECHIEWKDGSIRLIRIRDTLVEVDGSGKTIQRMCQDITEERFQQEQAIMAAEEKATLDPMTQIKNKKAIESIIREQIAKAAEQVSPIAIGFVDIDNFRDYNTRYGHLQGDEVIKYVAKTVKDAVSGGFVGRNGGDEFAFVIPDARYEVVEDAMKVIHKKLNEGIMIKELGKKIPTPCSIGVILVCKNELAYDYVMEQSDAAMYEAKARGKNTYYILNCIEEA